MVRTNWLGSSAGATVPTKGTFYGKTESKPSSLRRFIVPPTNAEEIPEDDVECLVQEFAGDVAERFAVAAHDALLDAAVAESQAPTNLVAAEAAALRAASVAILGGAETLGRVVASDENLVDLLSDGVPAAVLPKLREAGWPQLVLETVIAPRRTLMRRKSVGQRLTRGESDAAWRLAHVLALASQVLNGHAAAHAWLTRPKPAFGGRTPVDLLETSVGTAYVESLLRRLDSGNTV